MSRPPHRRALAQVGRDEALQHPILHKNVAEPCARAITEFGLIPDGFGAINIRLEVINKENVCWGVPDQLGGSHEELGLRFAVSDMEARNHTIKPVKEGHVVREVVKMQWIRIKYLCICFSTSSPSIFKGFMGFYTGKFMVEYLVRA
jgi:hypothetical protein